MSLIRFDANARLYTYIVAFDAGNAPNPYHGVCTLGICKPAIRRSAEPGDVIVGLDSATRAKGRIVYCMVVDESLPWPEYIRRCQTGELPRGKIPKDWHDQGDCIWLNAHTAHEPRKSHSRHTMDSFDADVRNGQNVLIGRKFWYFGRGDQHSIQLSGELTELIAGRGHRCQSNHRLRDTFADFFNGELSRRQLTTPGRYGEPLEPPSDRPSSSCAARRKLEAEMDAEDEEA